ncbi:MAG TPA: 4'-phosphopantetheinyl transferase superfamily protein, partial [Solirubrobacteraceae bacterium]
RIRPCDAPFAESICTPAERAELAGLPDRELVALWCSKEALAKALGDAVRYDPRRLESPMRWPDGRAGSWRAAALAVAPGHTGWLCWQAGRRIPA